MLQSLLSSEKVSPGLLSWHPDYQSALLSASRSRKPILLFQSTGPLDELHTAPLTRLARDVLFCAPEIALHVMSHFEPAWQEISVSGDTRSYSSSLYSVYGNVSTFLCTADGAVLDVLPGIYEPGAYLFSLCQFVSLHDRFLEGGWNSVLNSLSNSFLQIEPESLPCVPSANFLIPQGEGRAEWDRSVALSAKTHVVLRKRIRDHLAGKFDLAPCEISNWLFDEICAVEQADPVAGFKTLFQERKLRC